jgi:hypothetical protein
MPIWCGYGVFRSKDLKGRREMSVNPVVSGNTHVAHVQTSPQAHAERVGEKENDGDGDDANKQAVQSTPRPAVNTQGQPVGTIIDVIT